MIRIKVSRKAFTLVELLVALGVGSILLVAVLSLSFFSARSFAALTNYVDLDNLSRNALDIMTREIRQADALVGFSSSRMDFRHTASSGTAYTISYVYNPEARTLSRIEGGQTRILLRECDFLEFTTYQRNHIAGTWDQFPTSDLATCKLVQLAWVCSRTILGARVNTESVQSAKVVIRKK
jgi:prepilin-type N-terminal cleavage/methylation domain-containing protein